MGGEHPVICWALRALLPPRAGITALHNFATPSARAMVYRWCDSLAKAWMSSCQGPAECCQTIGRMELDSNHEGLKCVEGHLEYLLPGLPRA